MTFNPPEPETQAGAPRPVLSSSATDARRGLIPGGRGGPEDELLEDGQEEVFSRTDVEGGAIEHSSDTDSDGKL